jgi:hypothetical protein
MGSNSEWVQILAISVVRIFFALVLSDQADAGGTTERAMVD